MNAALLQIEFANQKWKKDEENTKNKNEAYIMSKKIKIETSIEPGTNDITDKEVKKTNVGKESKDDTAEIQNKIGERETCVIVTEKPDSDKMGKEAENQNKTEINECFKISREESHEDTIGNATEGLSLIEQIEVREIASKKDDIGKVTKDSPNKEQEFN